MTGTTTERATYATFRTGAPALVPILTTNVHQALSGDTVKAKRAYDDLLTLWKNADPDIPVLEEARAEYARLR